jgi:hypothetical protein
VSKSLPESPQITAVEAACWLGFGEALTCDDVAGLKGARLAEVCKQAKQGERLLFDAHMRGEVCLTGRRRNANRSEILDNREPIPGHYFTDNVTLQLRTNCVGPDAAGKFVEFERNQDLSIWEEVKAPTHEVRALGTSTPSRSTIGAERRCQRWLEELMEKSKRPGNAKGYYAAKAKEEFRVTGRAFSRAWSNAIVNTGRTEWSKSGRKPLNT